MKTKQSKLDEILRTIAACVLIFMFFATLVIALIIVLSYGIHNMTSEEFIVQVPCIDKNNNPINGVTCDENILCGGKMKWVESSLCLEVEE